MDDNGEYLIKTAPTIEWQKWLNQWKHSYEIIIIACDLHEDKSTIAIKRTPK